VRIPKWRAHGTATYHATQNWDVIAALDYRGKQFANDDNSDTAGHVYGASDEYVLVNFKTAYTMDVGHDMKAKFSVGIDNLLDEDYYDFHPYPQRTYFANVSLDI
jgi:iron complex outermembrane recepter protein